MHRLFLPLILLLGTAVVSADGPAKDVPELQVLSNYIGTWDVVYDSERAPFKDGRATATWILDGRYVQKTSELAAVFPRPKTLKITELMTYDQGTASYRKWAFVSNGRTLMSTGVWNAKTKTMTWESHHDAGTATTRTETFRKDGGRSFRTYR